MSDSSFDIGSSDDFVEQYKEKKRRKRMHKKAYYKNKRRNFIRENLSSSDSDVQTHESPNLNSSSENSQDVVFQYDYYELSDEKNLSENLLSEQQATHIEVEESSSENFFTSESEEKHDTSSSFEASSEDEQKPFQALYKDANISVYEFLLTMKTLKNKHSLTDSAINDLLKALQIILPKGNSVPKNLNLLEKKSLNEEDADHFKICSKCHNIKKSGTILSLKIETENCVKCKMPLVSFVTFNIENQIKKILAQRCHLKQVIDNNKQAREIKPLVTSATCGRIYQNAIQQLNKNALVISFNLNTDGAPLTNSKNYSMWPLMGSLVELNTKTREKFTNIVFFGKKLLNKFLFFLIIVL